MCRRVTPYSVPFPRPPPLSLWCPNGVVIGQVTNPVQFEQSLTNVLGNGFECGYECGPGKVVAGIMKRVDRKAQMTNIEV